QLARIAPAMADGLTKAAALAYETGTLAIANQIASLRTARDLRLASARLGYDEKAERAALKTYVEQTEVFRRRVQALHDASARGGEDCSLLIAQFHHAVAVADLARAEEARADEMTARIEAVKLADELWTAARDDYSAGVIELTTLLDVLRGWRDAKLSLGLIAGEDYSQETMKRAIEESARELEELRKRVEALREQGAKGGEDVNYYAVLAQQAGAIRINAGGVMPLARRAVDLARKRLDATRTAYETGTATVFALYPCFDGIDAVQAWLEEVREKEGAEASNTSEDERIDTIKQRLRIWRRIKALSDQGAKGGEAVDRRYAECQYVLARLRQYAATRQQEAQPEVNGVRTNRE
ncbi:MAG TPA: hypothetical protein DD670_01500, partial [Planctomycetaceae bacterium]|nr:hypothetical protein [Planctomycetaceae bacterium]